ncbi:MAG: hypothetical protein AAB426_11800, partial [Myxococcota bacterium]
MSKGMAQQPRRRRAKPTLALRQSAAHAARTGIPRRARHATPSPAPATKERLRDPEPTDIEIAAEQSLVNEEQAPKGRAARQIPAPGKDLLASYMEQLSGIPLFTPEQELQRARELEALEHHTWGLLLATPKATQILCHELKSVEPTLVPKVESLLTSYRRTAMQRHARRLPLTHARRQVIDSIVPRLRDADFDKELLERMMQRLRRLPGKFAVTG